jgi:hypothetical protein
MMKKSFNRIVFGFALALILARFDANAQSQLPGGPSSINGAMMKLFADNNSFTATAEIKVLDKAGKETTRMPMNWLMLDGKSRLEMDMNQVQSSLVPAAALGELKQAGLDNLVSVKRPDKRTQLLIYKNAKSYTEQTLTADEIADLDKNYKIDKTKIGKETINGHPCEKSKVVLTPDKGEKTEIIVWNATDLKGFPMQMRILDPDSAVVVTFKDVKLVKPEPGLFEPPVDLTKFDSTEKLIMSRMH